MRILIAEDDPVSRRLLQGRLQQWGYEVEVACDGFEAASALQAPDPPPIAVLDWMMPGQSGVSLCRLARAEERREATHIILLTARGRREDLLAGFEAGADDYLVKPYVPEELRARVGVGARITVLRRMLAARVSELETALADVRQLSGLLPICCYCKRVRDDRNYWQQLESYISKRSDARFSHSICPDCNEMVVRPMLEEIGKET